MKRFLASAVTSALAFAAVAATATPAAAEQHYVSASCDQLSTQLMSYPVGGTVEVVVDGAVVDAGPLQDQTQAGYGYAYWFSFDLDWDTAHQWSVTVDSDLDSYDWSTSGTSVPCASDPDVYADASATCQNLSVSIGGYPWGSRVAVTVDGQTVEDSTFDSWFSRSYSLDWATAHTWTVVIDAADDALDRTLTGTSAPCGEDPRYRVDVTAWCGWMSASVHGFPAGTTVTARTGDLLLDERTLGDLESYWNSWSMGPASFDWTITVDATDDALDRTKSGTVTCGGGGPSPTAGAGSTCGSVDVWADASAYLSGSRIAVVIDGETVQDSELTEYFSMSYEVDWQTAHTWSATITEPDGYVPFDKTGTSEPCATDPTPPVSASSWCGSIGVNVSDAELFVEGGHIELVVDGTVARSQDFVGSTYVGYEADPIEAHTWAVTVTSPSGYEYSTSGATSTCSVDSHLNVWELCDGIEVSYSDTFAPVGGTITVTVDGDVLETTEWDGTNYRSWFRVDQNVGHDWTVTLDSLDDRRDLTKSGRTWTCPAVGTLVQPENPVTITECGATLEDIVLPPATEAVSYELTDQGIVARAAEGFFFPYTIGDGPSGSQWQRINDSLATLGVYSALRPRCDLEVVSVAPVCVDGVPYVDYAVARPEGIEDGTLSVEWVGPNGGYDDVVYAGMGYDRPFATRDVWPGFITNDDGTVSPTYDPDWRLADIDLSFYTSVSVTEGQHRYSIYYGADYEDAPTADPCAAPSKSPHPIHPEHPAHPVFLVNPGWPGRQA